jgi:tetratricopeptide (TPR) repeat protein
MRSFLAALAGAVLCAAPLRAQTLEQALELYHQNRLDESLPVLQQLADADPANVEARAWLADNLRRTGDAEGALTVARQVLRDAPCHAHAHDVVASILGQEFWEPAARDSAQLHVTRGVECDPDDGSLWFTYWMAAMMRQDEADELRAQRRVAELRFIPEPVMELARWMLRASPRGAVLFANGDWDYFPLRVAQTAEGLRPDVTVVLLPMLEVPWYVRRLAAQTGYPVPPELEGIGDHEALEDEAGNVRLTAVTAALWTAEQFQGRQARPLVVAYTASTEWVRDVARPRWEGPVYTLLPPSEDPPGDPVIDTGAFAGHLPLLDVARLRGPRTHPRDRSPIRRTGTHPAEYVVNQLYAYGSQRLDEGRPDDARQALALIETLRATGNVRGEYLELPDFLRAAIDGQP